MFEDNAPRHADYTMHDPAYQRKKEAGFAGWSSAEDLAKQIKLLNQLFLHPDIPLAGKVLDLGCGAGNISFWLEGMGYRVTGIDASSVAINWAKEQAALSDSKVNFAVANAARANLKLTDQFDLILDHYSLHCIIGKDRDTYIGNVFDHLKPGGIYICKTMCNAPKDPKILSSFDPKSRAYMRNNLAVRYMGLPEDIINEIKTIGLELLQTELMIGDFQDSMSIIAQKP